MLTLIIPVLNEEKEIYSLLQLLRERALNPELLEIIIVDGGSIDQTINKVKGFCDNHRKLNIKLIHAPRGRGKQLHKGAQAASTDLFYFLHVDSHPPNHYDQHIIKAIAAGHTAGCFKMRFRSSHPWLKFIGWFTRFSWRACRGGDQSQYITRSLYKKIGGYPIDVPIYEDYILIHRLYNLNNYYVIPQWLTTSARRYHEIGVWKLQWFYLTIYWKKRRGASIDEIYQYYTKWCQSPAALIEQRSA